MTSFTAARQLSLNYWAVGLYSRFILPRLIHAACGTQPVAAQRERLVPLAEGRVVEIGIGSGHNLPNYDPARVEKIWGVDPSSQLLAYARRAAQHVPLDVELIEAPAEQLSLPIASVDTVVVTFTLCSVQHVNDVLSVLRRVLKPDGRLLFCEHGVSPDPKVHRWQKRLTPLWSRIGGGCHLDRDIPTLLGQNGFVVSDLTTEYITGWRPASYVYRGVASIR